MEGEEDANTGDNNVDLVKVEETVDEECLSDDDMPRGKTFRFTPVGEAALAVDTASGAGAHASRNAKRVGLRRRGEGARWDSAALGLGHRGLPKRYSRASTGAKDSHVWTPLTNPAEMEFYRFAVASDPGDSIAVAFLQVFLLTCRLFGRPDRKSDISQNKLSSLYTAEPISVHCGTQRTVRRAEGLRLPPPPGTSLLPS